MGIDSNLFLVRLTVPIVACVITRLGYALVLMATLAKIVPLLILFHSILLIFPNQSFRIVKCSARNMNESGRCIFEIYSESKFVLMHALPPHIML